MSTRFLTSLFLSSIILSHSSFAQADKTPEQLLVVTSLTVNGNSIDVSEDSLLRKHLKIELIGGDIFMAKQKTAVKYLVADTNRIRKVKGVLRLPTAKGSRKFTDKLTDGDDRAEFSYLGQVSSLNAYLVECLYWEDMAYKLVSKTTGADIQSFSAMPYLSADKKRIISIHADPYETDTHLELFSVVNSKFKNILGVIFKNWMPSEGIHPIFWGNDGKIYVPVQYSDKFWKADGSFNEEYQYIRISIL